MGRRCQTFQQFEGCFAVNSPCNIQLIALHISLSSGDHLVDDVDGETREQVDCSVDWREWPTVRGRRLTVASERAGNIQVPMSGEQITLAS